ncbi:hypothetical protein [Eubacterium sp.]|uniref:hypothetical protein n=1 Tax=Eubacterium sp. TaxID=142586 RepID=UPI003A9549D3
MKAVVKFKDNGMRRQKTIEVEKNEPTAIVRKFIGITCLSKYTYITTVKCGRLEYQWFDDANSAF